MDAIAAGFVVRLSACDVGGDLGFCQWCKAYLADRERRFGAAGMAQRLRSNGLTRRDTLWLFAASSSALALQGCATSPVTG